MVGKRFWIALLAAVVVVWAALASFRDSDATVPNNVARVSDASTPDNQPSPPSPLTIPAPRIARLATWNINFGNQNLQHVAAELEKVDADIVCLQETTQQSEAVLATTLKARYPHSEAFGHQAVYFAERFLVLSKKPWTSVRFVPPARNFFGHVLIETSLCGTPVQIVSVHLAPFTANGVESLAGLYSAMGQTEVDHQHEIQAVLNSISLESPVVILGDFNSLSGMVAPRTLKDVGLKDAFADMEANADQTHRTWHWPVRGAGELRLRIDYVFHSTHLEPKAAQVISSRASDHDLLVVDFCPTINDKHSVKQGK